MSKSQSYYYFYPIQVWLSTILLSSLILYTFIAGDKFIESMGLLVIIIPYGLILSLPALLLYCLIYYSLNKTDINANRLKLILTMSGIAFILVTFYFLTANTITFIKWEFPFSYSVGLIGVTLLTKLKVKTEE